MRDFEHPSDCMKTGLCCKSINKHVAVVEKFIELNPRGAYFGQIDMFNAFDMALADDDDMRSKLYAKATPEMEHAEEVVRLTVYKLRVVFSHLRIAYDNGFDDEHELKELFDMMSIPNKDKRKCRRTERLGVRLNPFVNFRSEDDDSDTEEAY